MSSRLTFADHESVCAGHALFCQSAHIGHACPYIHALCSIYGETCWKKDLLKQICGGRHDNSLCVRCRLHLSQQGGETDWRFHLREAFYGLLYKYFEVVNMVLLFTRDFHDSCFGAIKLMFLGVSWFRNPRGSKSFNEADQSSDYNQSSHFYNFHPCTKASFLTFQFPKIFSKEKYVSFKF